jgi:hypothetical protein
VCKLKWEYKPYSNYRTVTNRKGGIQRGKQRGSYLAQVHKYTTCTEGTKAKANLTIIEVN